jgi:hypothetical protein
VGKLAGLPEPVLVLIALLVSTAIPFSFIAWLGWWKDAGFGAPTQNVPALTRKLTIRASNTFQAGSL